jgi:hypothetical protein
VNDTHFGLIHKIALDDQPYASPLIYTGLTIAGGVHNVVYMETANNSVYALDATTGAQLWHVTLGTAAVHGDGTSGNCNDESGKWGIIGTPVISPANSCLYVDAITKGSYGDAAGVLNHRLHKLDLATGNEDAGSPVLVTGTSFVPGNENQRPALLNANGKIYVCFGSHCDSTPSNGRIFAFDANTLAKTNEFDPSVPGGSATLDSIWQSGQGPAADSSGNIYFYTGNGTWDGVNNFAMSALKMSPTLGLSSWFTANDYVNLNNNDEDLSSGGCMVMPGTGYIVGGGKTGKIYVLNPASLGGVSTNDANAIQVFQATSSNSGFEDKIHGSPAYFVNSTGPAIYLWGANDHGRCFQYVNGKFNTTASSVTAINLPEFNMTGNGECGASISISANGTTNGIAWAYGVLSGDANNGTEPGVLLAYDANNLGTQLWTSQDNASRDSMGNLAKYSYPVIANGLVYISEWGTASTGTGGLCIYGPISGGGGTGTTVSLSSSFNIAGLYTDGTTFSGTGGLDAGGHAYSATLLGSSVTWSGVNFAIGAANANNVVTSTGQVITLPSGSFTSLNLLATAINGNQASQTFTVTYTDNSTSVFTQSLSDWFTPQNFAGESIAVSMAYRNLSTGLKDPRTFDLYGYSFTLNSAKTVKSITLPNNANIKVAAVTLIPVAQSEGPYGGTAAAIPGTVQAENYDTGGQGVAYNVNSINGTDNGYRSDGVDLEVTSDTGGGVDLGWTSGGQWFKYTVNVATAGNYTVSFRVAAPTAVTDAFHLSNSAGTNLSGNVNVPATGGFQTWTTVTATVTLPSGLQTLTLNQDNGNWNVNYMGFASAGGSTKLLPTQNAAVRDGTYATTNFNGATTIRVKNDVVNNNRHAYFTFDTTSMGSVSSAVINLYVVSTGSSASRTITVYEEPTTSWLESTITWNNAPAAGTQIGSFNVSTTVGIYYNFDVTSYVQAQRTAGNKVVSFELINNTTDVNGLVDFASKEATTGQPGLTCTP